MFERTLDIISLFVMAISKIISLFASFFFPAVSNRKIRKIKLFHEDSPDYIKSDKN